jgi:hypothetical protein
MLLPKTEVRQDHTGLIDELQVRRSGPGAGHRLRGPLFGNSTVGGQNTPILMVIKFNEFIET